MGEFGELKSKYAEEVERRLAVEEEMVALQSKLNDGQREKFIQGSAAPYLVEDYPRAND